MNKQTENQAPTPDFGYIMNQPDSVSAPVHSKKNLVLFSVIGVLVVLSLGIAIFGKFVATRPPTSKSAPTSNVSISSFMTEIAKSDDASLTAAKAMLDPSLTTSDTTATFSLRRFRQSVDLTTCKQVQTIKQTANQGVFGCKSKAGKAVTVTVTAGTSNNKVIITGYKARASA